MATKEPVVTVITLHAASRKALDEQNAAIQGAQMVAQQVAAAIEQILNGAVHSAALPLNLKLDTILELNGVEQDERKHYLYDGNKGVIRRKTEKEEAAEAKQKRPSTTPKATPEAAPAAATGESGETPDAPTTPPEA